MRIAHAVCQQRVAMTCADRNRSWTVLALLLALGACGGGGSSGVTQQPLFIVPQNTGGYFPNPANTYMAAAQLTYESGRIVVVRGKAAVFPDTYAGDSIFVAANPP